MNYRYLCLQYNRIMTFFAPYIRIWPFVKGCNIHSQNQPKHEKCPTIIGKLSINLDRAVGFSFMPGLFYTAYHHSRGLLGRHKTRPPIWSSWGCLCILGTKSTITFEGRLYIEYFAAFIIPFLFLSLPLLIYIPVNKYIHSIILL